MVVRAGHLTVGQRLARHLVDLEAAVERQHVEELHEQLAVVTCVQRRQARAHHHVLVVEQHREEATRRQLRLQRHEQLDEALAVVNLRLRHVACSRAHAPADRYRSRRSMKYSRRVYLATFRNREWPTAYSSGA